MNQTSGTTATGTDAAPSGAPADAHDDRQQDAGAAPSAEATPASTQDGGDATASAGQDSGGVDSSGHDAGGFQSRGRARRRARFLRKARELAYRDLGGLVFSLHRFGQRNDALVLAKLTTLGHIDGELRAIEDVLAERQPVTVLREAGITACPRCAAIHSSEDNFCPRCGLSMGRHADLPAGFQSPAAPTSLAAQPGTPAPVASAAPASAQAPASERSPTPAPAVQPPRPATAPASPRQAPTTAAVEDDGPTEILRPPAPGS